MTDIRFFLIKMLWKIKRISRAYCWADAVTWALGYGNGIRKANHKCYYCFACNTDAEIEQWQSEQQP